MNTDENISGTIAYIAPEVFQGESPKETADLYAVGVIAYELFANRHPFDLAKPGRLIQDIIFTPPNLEILDVDPDIKIIIGRLLEKTSYDRYATAYEVIDVLRKIKPEVIPRETIAIRESFLQAAQFVGRDEEIATLNEAMEQAAQGKGSAWLVGGESGVGK